MPIREQPWPQGTPSWVDCQVDDTAAAKQFYEELFGWDIYDSGPDAGGYLMAYRKGKPVAGIGPKPPGAPMLSTWTTYLAADDADAIADKISASGGELLTPPFDVLDVGRMCVAMDATGAVFGVWQAKTHHGAGLYNEHGAYCWNELHTNGYAKAQEFYAKVFGWEYAKIGDGENFAYVTFTLHGGEVIGGINDESKMGNADGPSYWLTWFQSDDTDASLAKAVELGATALSGVDDSPFGRMAVVRAPQGEVFAIIDPSTTVGESPS